MRYQTGLTNIYKVLDYVNFLQLSAGNIVVVKIFLLAKFVWGSAWIISAFSFVFFSKDLSCNNSLVHKIMLTRADILSQRGPSHKLE